MLINVYYSQTHFEEIGHALQMFQGNNTAIGCATVQYQDEYQGNIFNFSVTACDYYWGNIVNASVYEILLPGNPPFNCVRDSVYTSLCV